MSVIDWIVLVVTLIIIVVYGIYKSRGTKNIHGFLLADKQLPWYHVTLSVMATQASAITFISAPGQAYSDGLRFIQFYFGLPLAMILICTSFIPVFQKLNVYTAYEYLEKRFDNKTRTLTAFLFLLQRGLSTGVTIYAPAIILSTILDIDLLLTTFLVGILVITYTVYGGTKAVSYTQVFQMSIIFSGLFIAAFTVVYMLPEGIGFTEALHIAGKMGRLNAIDTKFDLNNRYNIWSGIIGGFFLQLSYFGTDQSQVGRYLTGKSIAQSRLGLIMNGFVKIPMQFLILLIGTLVFSFYQFHAPPIFFNKNEVNKIEKSEYKKQFDALEIKYNETHSTKQVKVFQLVKSIEEDDEKRTAALKAELLSEHEKSEVIKKEASALIKMNNPKADINDSNFVFLSFVTGYFPVGLVGLLIAIIFLAAMGSTASGINSLVSTSVVDFYKRLVNKNSEEKDYLRASRWATVIWGVFCIIVALYAGKLGNLIEAVNILGSLFYGTILGIFMVAFFMKKVKGHAVFISAIIAEVFVVVAWLTDMAAFLWLNLIGCLLVMGIAWVVSLFYKERSA